MWSLGRRTYHDPCCKILLDIVWSLWSLAVCAYLGRISFGVLWVFHLWRLRIYHLWLWNLHISEHPSKNTSEFFCYYNSCLIFILENWRIFPTIVGICPNFRLCWSSSKSHNFGSYCCLLDWCNSGCNSCNVLLQNMETISTENKIVENSKKLQKV